MRAWRVISGGDGGSGQAGARDNALPAPTGTGIPAPAGDSAAEHHDNPAYTN